MKPVIFFVVMMVIPSMAYAEDYSEVLKKIRAKASVAYIKYKGYDSVQDQVIRNFDKESGKLKDVEVVTLKRTEFFYEKPVSKVISYMKNNDDMDPSDYSPGERDPIFLPFAKDSDENYEIKVNGKLSLMKVPCYELLIIPKDDSMRHFKGRLYVSEETLDMVYMEGSLAYLPPVIMDSILIQIYFSKVDDVSVMSRAVYTTEMNIPLKFPNVRQIKTVNIKEIKLIKAN